MERMSRTSGTASAVTPSVGILADLIEVNCHRREQKSRS